MFFKLFTNRALLGLCVAILLAPLTGRRKSKGRAVEVFVHTRGLVLTQEDCSHSNQFFPDIELTLGSTDLKYLSAAEAGPNPVRDLAWVLKLLGRMAWVYTDMHSCLRR